MTDDSMPAAARLRRLGLPLALLLLCAPIGAGAQELALTPEQASAAGIETAPLAPAGAIDLRGLPALVAVPPSQKAIVSAPLAGLVERVDVALNQPVSRGQRLARLLSPALVDLQRSYLEAAAQLDLARSGEERDARLLGEGIIAESRYRASHSRLQEASTALQERTHALALAGMSPAAIERLRADRSLGSGIDITAPLSGVIVEQPALVGQRVEAAALLFSVARLAPLWVEIEVPVAQLARIRENAAVAIPEFDAAGRVIAVGRIVGANQTVQVRAEVTRHADRLRPGQFVEARIASAGGAGEAGWTVPAESLVQHAGRVILFARTGAGFRAVPVSPASQGGAQVLIRGPLEGRERIAVRGVSTLKSMLAGLGER